MDNPGPLGSILAADAPSRRVLHCPPSCKGPANTRGDAGDGRMQTGTQACRHHVHSPARGCCTRATSMSVCSHSCNIGLLTRDRHVKRADCPKDGRRDWCLSRKRNGDPCQQTVKMAACDAPVSSMSSTDCPPQRHLAPPAPGLPCQTLLYGIAPVTPRVALTALCLLLSTHQSNSLPTRWAGFPLLFSLSRVFSSCPILCLLSGKS